MKSWSTDFNARFAGRAQRLHGRQARSTSAMPALLVGASLFGAAASAHHAFAAEFDANKPVQLHGVLTKIEWTNPHGWVYIDVTDTSGKKTNWAVEFGGPNALLRRGIRLSDFPIGIEVQVKGYLAKSGRPVVNGTSVKLPDGRDFFTGSSGTGAPIEGPAAR
jgi:hypothetical protein